MPFRAYASHMIALSDYGELQTCYAGMSPVERAQAVYDHAEPSVRLALGLLDVIAGLPDCHTAITQLRANDEIMRRLRHNEARATLLDAKVDYLAVCAQKLLAWHQAIRRVAIGEAVNTDNALGIILQAHQGVSAYLSLVPLILGEMSHIDAQHASQYAKATAQLRRCATMISDCETASDIMACLLPR